ncbi:MAG: glycosyltransferase family 2 protein [Ignavibacteriae bacterium]|nr:glycosyltransferase family 2 protein [Ignavibacteriota bacterium]
MSAPLVSVLIPLHNAAPFVCEAISSVAVAHRAFALEILVFDDASTDDGADRVRALNLPYLRLLSSPVHQGIVRGLNTLLGEARGKYIARMDADDVADPRRIVIQSAYLDAHRDIDMCGTWMRSFGTPFPVTWSYPELHEDIRAELLFNPALIHGTAMFRRDLMERCDMRFSEDYPHAEDYEWIVRLSRHARLANVQRSLYNYRVHPGQTASRKRAEQRATTRRIQAQLLSELGLHLSDQSQLTHEQLAYWRIPRRLDALDALHDWLHGLEQANARSGVYDPRALRNMCARRFFHVCDYFAHAGFVAARRFRSFELYRAAHAGPLPRAMQSLRCLLRRDVPGRVDVPVTEDLV